MPDSPNRKISKLVCFIYVSQAIIIEALGWAL